MPTCREDALVDVRGRTRPRFLVKGLIPNASGAYDAFDPRTSELRLNFDDRGLPVEIVVPAEATGSVRWGARIYQWKGAGGGHQALSATGGSYSAAGRSP